MTPEQETVRKKRFEEIKQHLQRPEHFREFYLQLQYDIYYTLNINLDTLALSLKGVKEALSPFKPSTGWKREIHEIFKKTLFKKIRLGQVKPEDAILSYANDLGFLSSVKYASEKIVAEWDSTDEFLAQAVTPLSPIDLSTLKSGNELMDNWRRAPAEALAKLLNNSPLSKQKDLAEEFGKGTKNLFADDLSSPYETSATFVYQDLLFLGDYVEVFNTVEELHAFLSQFLTPEEVGGLTAFRQLCTRIKLKSS